MTGRDAKRWIAAVVVLPGLVGLFCNVSLLQGADEPAGKIKAAAQVKKPAAKQRAKPRGRLPVYYSQVVTPKQREQIYAIQGKYRAEREELIARLTEINAIIKEETEAVLSEEQKQQLAEILEKAKAEARKKAAARKAKLAPALPKKKTAAKP